MFLFPIILQSLKPASFSEIGIGVSPLFGLGRIRKIWPAPSICKTSISPMGNRWSLLTTPSTFTLPLVTIRIASLDVLAYPRISLMTITRGRLFSLEKGPGLVFGAHVRSLRFIGQNPGAGSRLSCLDPPLRAIVYPSTIFDFSERSPLRHLSDRLRLVMSTLLE